MRAILFLAFRHLIARRRQSLIAVVGMAIGVAVLVAMTSMMKGFEAKFMGETLRSSPHVEILKDEERGAPPSLLREEAILATQTQDSGFSVVGARRERPSDRPLHIKSPNEIVAFVRQSDGVLAVAPALVGSAVAAFAGQQQRLELRGIDPVWQEKVTVLSTYVTEGKYEDMITQLDTILLGAGVAEKLGAHAGDRLVVGAPGRAPMSLKVVGIIDTGIPPIDNIRALVPLRTAQVLFGQPEQINSIGIRLADPSRADNVAENLTAATGYKTESWRTQNANWLGIISLQNTVTNIVVAALLVVAAFGILNILIMIVLEKKRDIAILRSVGLTRKDILRVFVVEGAIMGVIGAILGCGLGWVIIDQLERTRVDVEGLVKAERFLMLKDPWLYVYAAVFAIFAALVASVLPARRAASTEPVDVIRGQI